MNIGDPKRGEIGITFASHGGKDKTRELNIYIPGIIIYPIMVFLGMLMIVKAILEAS